jgi:hypothetical protein
MLFKMINFNKKKNNQKSGFTLVETLVALFVFSLSVLTVMLALSRGLSGTIYAKDKVVAEYLSQEGIEYFRNIRDNFQFYAPDKTTGWKEFVDKLVKAGCADNDGCYFWNNEENDFLLTKEIQIDPCPSECLPFNYDAPSGKYNYDSGSGTTYSRKMSVIVLNANNVKITSAVTYHTGSSASTVSLSENLTNWIE